MQIICKSTHNRFDEAEKEISETVSKVLPAAAARKVTIKRVFPEVTSGQRARLFTIDLPNVSESQVKAVVDTLQSGEGIEYAQIPASKQPL